MEVTIDSINRDIYQAERNAVLDQADEKLLEEDSHAPQDTSRSKQHAKSKLSKGYEENYFLVIREDGVYDNELETRVRLKKRRQKLRAQVNNTKLVVKHRPLNAAEHKMQVLRDRQLEPQGDDDEEIEESEHEEEAPKKVVEIVAEEESRRSR